MNEDNTFDVLKRVPLTTIWKILDIPKDILNGTSKYDKEALGLRHGNWAEGIFDIKPLRYQRFADAVTGTGWTQTEIMDELEKFIES